MAPYKRKPKVNSILLSLAITGTKLTKVLGQNDLVQNPGFVQGVLTPWTCHNDQNNTCGILHSAPPEPDYLTFLDPGSSITQPVAAGNNLPYLAQYDSYCLNRNTSIPCNGIPVTISVGNDSGTDIIQDYIQHISRILTPGGNGNQIGLTYPNNSTYLNEQVYVDNITLWPLSNGPVYTNNNNLLTNANFELSTNKSGIDHGWTCLPTGCCSLETVGKGQFAEEGLNFLQLPTGCQLVQAAPLVKDRSYTLGFYGYCLDNGCDTAGNLGIHTGNPVNNFQQSQNLSFNLAKGDVFSGPYGAFQQQFEALGNDTISITASYSVRLDNFTLVESSKASNSQGSSSSGSSSNVGAIVGGVIGGLAILAAGVVGFLWWRRRSYNQQSAELGAKEEGTAEEKEGAFLTSTPINANYPPPPPASSTSPPPLSNADSFPYQQPSAYNGYGGGTDFGDGRGLGSDGRLVPEIMDGGDDRPDEYPSFR